MRQFDWTLDYYTTPFSRQTYLQETKEGRPTCPFCRTGMSWLTVTRYTGGTSDRRRGLDSGLPDTGSTQSGEVRTDGSNPLISTKTRPVPPRLSPPTIRRRSWDPNMLGTSLLLWQRTMVDGRKVDHHMSEKDFSEWVGGSEKDRVWVRSLHKRQGTRRERRHKMGETAQGSWSGTIKEDLWLKWVLTLVSEF